MRTIKILIFLILLSTPVFSQVVPQANPYIKMFYGARAEQINDSTTSYFDAGAEVNLELKYRNFTFDILSRSAMSFVSGGDSAVGYLGALDVRFSYFIPKKFEPFFASFNEFDSLYNANVMGYTGVGVRVHVLKTKNFMMYGDAGTMFQYEDYTKEFANREKKNYTFAYYLSGAVSYSFLKKLKIGSTMRLIPVFSFNEVRFGADVWLISELFRKKDKLFFGREVVAEYELKIGIDTLSIDDNNYNRTRYSCASAFRIRF